MKPRILTFGLTALLVLHGGFRQNAYAEGTASKAAPPAAISTVPLDKVARHGFFYAGGQYVGELGPNKESTMSGAMYVEVMVPKQIRSPYPVVFLVKAMVTVEPGGPQIGNVNTATVEAGPRNPNSWGLTTRRFEYDPPVSQPSDLNVYLEEKQERSDEARCWLQVEPARKLARWKNIPVLDVSANGTYHRTFDACIPKWLNQAGVKADFVRLETAGITGNSHMMMLEKNSEDVIKFIVNWIQKNSTT